VQERVWQVRSPTGSRIRLTAIIWEKIVRRHPELREPGFADELARTITDPDYIVQGFGGELLALRWCTIAPGSEKYLCVVYRELDSDGFVITAYLVSRHERLLRRGLVWRREQS
jgi:hypothetical protein